MKIFVWATGMFLALLLGYVVAGPYLTVSMIKTSLAEQDAEKLSEYIEYPILRQNLKDQLNGSMITNTPQVLIDNPLGAFVAGLATKMVDGIVDSFVTPKGLAALMGGKKPSKQGDTKSSTPPQEDDLLKDATYSYDSINTFSIWVPNDEGEELRFVLRRDGLSWKLVNLIMPNDESE